MDVNFLRQSVPDWRIFDQGIEALSKSVTSLERQTQEENKAMSLNDLLIKVGDTRPLVMILDTDD